MLYHYLKIALRNLKKYKLQSLISILGLAVGITCFAFCSYLLRSYLDQDRNLTDAEQICFLYNQTEQGRKVHHDTATSTALCRDYPEIEAGAFALNIQPYTRKLCEITNENGTPHYFKENFLFTSFTFIDLFQLPLLSGNSKQLQEVPDALIITRQTALKLFGTWDAVGKTFTDINDFDNKKVTCTVQGVIEDFPERTFLSEFSGIILNTENSTLKQMQNEIAMNYVKVRKGTDLERLNNTFTHVQLKPICEFSSFISEGRSLTSPLLFFSIGLLVLLTALFNYLIFILGRIQIRIKECGIRKVNGADKRSLFILFFTEMVISFLTACFVSFILIELIVPFINSSFINRMPWDKMYLFELQFQYTGIGIACILLFCLLATHRLTRLSAIQSICSDPIIRRNSLLRNLFVGFQLAVCFLFLGGTWFVKQQCNQVDTTLSAGLSDTEKTRIYGISLNGDKLEAARPEILEKLHEDPRIETISRNGMSLLGAWQLRKGSYTWEGLNEEEIKDPIGFIRTDANYADLIKVKPTTGRFFSQGEENKAVVNESLARIIGKTVIGSQIGVKSWDGEMIYYEIVGILPDIINNQNGINNQFGAIIMPCIYLPYPDNYTNLTCYVKIAPGYQQDFQTKIKAEIEKHLHPGNEYYVANLKEHSNFYLQSEISLYRIITLFAIICILISLLGIYASIVLTTERRKKEVAIRKINGATPRLILQMFGKEYLLLLAVSAAIAFPILILILNKWIENYAVQIHITPLPFVVLLCLMAVFITSTIIWQILRIARTNPAEAIKTE